MFDLRLFVMKTIMGMIGNEPDYKVMEYALGWYSKSTLLDDDLIEIEAKIEEYRNPVVEEFIPDIPEPDEDDEMKEETIIELITEVEGE